MKKISYIVLLIAGLLVIAVEADAQVKLSDENASSIFEALDNYSFGRGEVTITQPAALRNRVGIRARGEGVEYVDGKSYLKMQGYRTQVFSGNNQRKSKEEAFKKEREIKAIFPDLATYVTYVAPFWKLRVGDFISHEEAYHTKLELSKAFPSYGKEMYIVREEVLVPLY